MTKKLKISDTLSIPVDIVTDTNAVLAKKGAGKTYTGSVLAEEMIGAGQRVVVIDPTDAWWGLRAKADGSLNGLPVVIFGGRHADLPLDENMGTVVADLIVDRKVDSCILCTKGFESDASRIRFLTQLGARLFYRSQEPLHLFLDEADDYLPQTVTGDLAKLKNVWSKIVKQGRLQGLGVTMITQRAAVLHKDVLSQISTLFVLQTTGPQDIDAIARWFRSKGDSHDEILDSLPRLKKGVCWVYSPEFLEIDPPEQIVIRERRTFNSSATPKVGERRVEPKGLAEVDLEALRQSLASTIAKAKAEDPKALRARIAELERELAKKPAPAPAERVVERVEVPLLAKHEQTMLENLRIAVDGLPQQIANLRAEIAKKVAPAPMPVEKPLPRPFQSREAREALDRIHTQVSDFAKAAKIGGGEIRVLTAIAQHRDGVDREQLSVLTGYKRSSRDTYIQRLRAAGFVDASDDLIRVTSSGLLELGSDFEPLPTGKALRDYWLGRLPEGERRILEICIHEHPGMVGRERISEETGYKRSSRDTYIQRLRSRKLVHANAMGVGASADLF